MVWGLYLNLEPATTAAAKEKRVRDRPMPLPRGKPCINRHPTADKNIETNKASLHGVHYCQERESASLCCLVP